MIRISCRSRSWIWYDPPLHVRVLAYVVIDLRRHHAALALGIGAVIGAVIGCVTIPDLDICTGLEPREILIPDPLPCPDPESVPAMWVSTYDGVFVTFFALDDCGTVGLECLALEK